MFDHIYPPATQAATFCLQGLSSPRGAVFSCIQTMVCVCASAWNFNMRTVLMHTVACGVAAATVRESSLKADLGEN